MNNVYKRQRTRDCASTECAGDPVEEEPCTGTLCAGIKHISIEPQLNAFKLFFFRSTCIEFLWKNWNVNSVIIKSAGKLFKWEV